MRTRLYKKPKRVYGVGVNDANYPTNPTENGKRNPCPFYSRWVGMLERGYCQKYKAKYPTYKDVSVCDEWLVFSVFKEWMEKQEWEGKELDKDIINPGNKIYSPSNCCFVDKEINYLLCRPTKKESGLPLGVCHDKNGRYGAYINISGKQKRIGRFDHIADAEIAYLREKISRIKDIANNCPEVNVQVGLLCHAKLMSERMENIR